MCRRFPELDERQIKNAGFVDLKDLMEMKSFRFDRTYESMSCFVQGNLCGCIDGVFLKDRQLQVYDMLTGNQMAEINVPNAKRYSLDSCDY